MKLFCRHGDCKHCSCLGPPVWHRNKSYTREIVRSVLDSAMFDCHAEGAPRPSVKWYKGGKEVDTGRDKVRVKSVYEHSTASITLTSGFGCWMSGHFDICNAYFLFLPHHIIIKWEQMLMVFDPASLCVILQNNCYPFWPRFSQIHGPSD